MLSTVRIAIGILGALMMLGGIVAFAGGAPAQGLWAMAIGVVAILAVTFERARYRSEAAEHSAAEPSHAGPGSGEPSVPGAPFRPTDEQFVDPTSGERLRVYIDSATGERRYHAEGKDPGR